MSIFRMFKKVPNHLWVAASNWFSRIVNVFVQLASIRLLMVGLGSEKYAVFILLTSLVGWYSLSDMGVGLSMQNYISEKRAKKESYSAYINTALIISILQWSLGILMIYLLSPVIAPVFLKQFGFMSDVEKSKSFFLVGVMFFSITLSGLTYKIWYAEHKGYLANIVPPIASLLGLAGIWLITQLQIANKLLLYLIVFNSPAMIIGIVLLVFKTMFFSTINLRPDWFVLKQIIHRAGRVNVFSILGLLITQIDYFVLSQMVKSNEIVVYSISTKLFSFMFAIYAAVLAAWHPVNAEMFIRSETMKMKSQAKNFIILGTIAIIVFTTALVFLMPKIVSILSPKEIITVPLLLIILLGSYFVIRVWNDTFVTMLVSMNKFRKIFIIAPIQVIVSASLQIALAYKFGINGIVLGLIFAYLLTSIWYLPRELYNYVR